MENLSRIVSSAAKMTLLGGGAVDLPDLENALRIAPVLICADSGGNQAIFYGFRPDFVIGDMDSADTAELRNNDINMVLVSDQSSTDFEKCIAAVGAHTIIAVGFLGRRLDHQLAAFNAVAKAPDRLIILVGEEDICFLCPAHLHLTLAVGERFSLFPMNRCTGTSRGLEWPIDGLELSPAGQIGTSNRVVDRDVTVSVHTGALICILPKHNLGHVAEVVRPITSLP